MDKGTLTKEQLYEYAWFQVLDEESLREAKFNETLESFALRNRYKKVDENTKLDYLVYKHELTLSHPTFSTITQDNK